MAIWTLGNNQLAKVQVQSLRSLPGLVLAFPTSNAFIKSKSKLFIVLRQHISVPARKYIASISPAGGKHDNPYLELPIVTALYHLLQGFSLTHEWLILGEMDLEGTLQPLGPSFVWQALQLIQDKDDSANWRVLIPAGTKITPLAFDFPIFTAKTVAEAFHTVQHDTGTHLPRAVTAPSQLPAAATRFLAHYSLYLSVALSSTVPLLITSRYSALWSWLTQAVARVLPSVSTTHKLHIRAQEKTFSDPGLTTESDRPVWSPKSACKINRLHQLWPLLTSGIIVIASPQRFSSLWWQEFWVLYEQTDLRARPHIIITQMPCDCGNGGSKNRCYCTSAQRAAWKRWFQINLRPYCGVLLDIPQWPPEEHDTTETPESIKKTIRYTRRLLRTQDDFTLLPQTDVFKPQLNYRHQEMLQRIVVSVQQYYKAPACQPEHWLQALELMDLHD